MKITLQERTADHVRIYFERTQDDQIDRMLPRSVNSLDQALENFAQTKLPDAKSYGKTIYADDRYIGDIWCYCIDPKETPNAMLSYCIFEKSCWGKGIASRALSLFLDEIVEKYCSSMCWLLSPLPTTLLPSACWRKTGFSVQESFVEDSRKSVYLEYRVQDRG